MNLSVLGCACMAVGRAFVSQSPVARQSPVAKSPHFAPAHGGAARQASGMWYDWQALASQSPHSPGDCLTTVKI
eukprot:scaffold34529_cov55-Cyclotella_meneghiniana.AAC.4